MKRLINPRFFLFAAIGLVLGILCGYQIMFGKWLFPIALVAVLALSLTILLLLKNKLYLLVLFVFIFALLGVGLFQAKIIQQQKQEVIARPVTLTGRVTDTGRMGNATNVLYLENCVYGSTKIGGRVKVAVYDGTLYQTGDILTVNGTLRSVYPFANNFDTDCLRLNCNYQLTDVTVLSQKSGNLTLDESIRSYIYLRCTENMFSYHGLMYALITGDSSAVETGVLQYYQYSGMVHLIAVSGMHLVYIITIIGFFINRLKLNPLAEFAVMIVPLVFFCYVCNWAPSILRALLMTVCTYLVRWISGRYDMLIALSFSVVTLLAVNPLYLFDVGWQLSVMSVLGMATLHLRIDRFLQSKKLNKFLYGVLSALSVSLSCTLSTFATIAHYFGEVPILGIFANLVGVPLMSWAFTAGLIGLLPWVFKYSLHLGDGILCIVTQVAKLVSSMDFAVVSLSAVAIAIAVTAVWLFVAGQYVNLKRAAKVAVSCALCLLLVACFVFAGVKVDCQDQVFVNVSYDCIDVVVTNKQGQAVVISNCQNVYSFAYVQSCLARYKCQSVTWVFTDFSQLDITQVETQRFAQMGVDRVYTLSNYANDDALVGFNLLGIPVVQVANNQTVGQSITVQSIYDGSLSGVLVNSGSINFVLSVGSAEQTANLANIISNADFYVVITPTSNYLCQNLTTFSLYQEYCATNYGANKYGNFTITEKDGTIVVNF